MHGLSILLGCFWNMTGVTGHLESPNYPHKYLINSTCEWLVTAQNRNSRLLLTLEVFSMEGGNTSKQTSVR